MMLSTTAALASGQLQAGGDPATIRDQLLGAVTDLLAVCRQFGYL